MRRFYPHILLAVLLLILAALWLRNWSEEADANQVGQTIVATPAKEVRDVPTMEVVVKKPVKVYQGGAALKDGLKLPRVAVEDPDVEVLASSKIDGRDDHPKTVTTVLNVGTGESETYVRTDPLPWFAMDKRGHIGIGPQLTDSGRAIRLEAEQAFFDIKDWRFVGKANYDKMQDVDDRWAITFMVEKHW